MNTKILILLILIVALGLVVGAVRSGPGVAGVSFEDGESAGEPANALSLSADVSAGALEVASVRLSEPGFVGIHRVTDDGVPGAHVGTSALLAAGSHTDVRVSTAERLEDGSELYAVLYHDSGNDEFEPLEDGPVLENGAIVMKSFTAHEGGNEEQDRSATTTQETNN